MSKRNWNTRCLVGVLILFGWIQFSEAQDKSPAQMLAEFERDWDETQWGQMFRRKTYMRESEDDGWMLRMRTLKGLVAEGGNALPALEKTLTSGQPASRILAAQAMSYLAPEASIEKLVLAAGQDEDAAVRLYAVDALGMSGKGAQVNWEELKKGERNRDVLRHIGYAETRKNAGVESALTSELANFDLETMNSAQLGKPAPDFNLPGLDGKKVKLSDFRGKSAVVLVFVYGDT